MNDTIRHDKDGGFTVIPLKNKLTAMRELEKKLKALQKQGYEQINIGQVIQWMYDIKRENASRRIERRENER